ncbi:MAG: RNA 2'-phosphotransferase [Candidatus Hydrothermarchaeota archaeon]|nr:MAG: RNA 2'-phosphotransferase [Candidatus Hydrothermarchaeota archaeon]
MKKTSFEVRVSKTMSYFLRHNPENLKISNEGFVEINELLKLLRKKFPKLTHGDLIRIIEKDEKGRFEIKNNMVRARYGHSIDLKLGYEEASEEILYHGTSRKAAKEILKEGLKPMGRRYVHLSKTIEDALEVGIRRDFKPAILEIDAKEAKKHGIKIYKATERIFLSDYIPPDFIKIVSLENKRKSLY